MPMPTDEHAEINSPAAFARLAPEQQAARRAARGGGARAPGVVRLAKDRQLEDYSAAGWPCRKCGAAVRAAPREWSCRSDEPVDWWWCSR
jgi:hypothetical protein